MSINAVKIPQNVYVEDRIIGPVTLRQIIITGMGAGLSYALYAAATKGGSTNIVLLAACWIPALIAAMFSFLKINDLTLFNIILLAIEGFNKPATRTWVSDAGISINIITKQTKKEAGSEFAASSAPVDKIADVTRELHEREKQLKELTAQGSMFDASEKQDEVVIQNKTKTNGAALPVNKNRVRTEELSTERTIDGVLTHERMHHLSMKNQL